MNGMIQFANHWMDWAAASSWQIALLAALIAAVAFATRKMSARFRYFLWSLLLIKVFLPPSMGAVWAIGHWGVEPLWNETRSAIPDLVTGEVKPVAPAVVPAASKSTSLVVPVNSPVAGTTAAAPAPVDPFKRTDEGKASAAVSSTVPEYQPLEEAVGEGTSAHSAGETAAGSRGIADWRTAAFFFWLVLCVAFLGVVGWRYVRLVRRLRKGRLVDEGPLRVELERIALAMGRSNPPDLVLSPDVTSPFLIGLFRPRIVLPASLPDTMSPEHLRNILLHELTHWKRGDVWVGWVQVLAQAIFWFHPLVWLANARIRHERECACDEEAVGRGACDPAQYGESLLKVLLASRGRSATQLGFLGIFERGTRIQKRLEGIMDRESRTIRVGWGGWAFIVLFALVFLPMAGVRATGAATPATLRERLQKPVTVNIEHSPKDNRLSVQYAVNAICEAAEIPYQWEKSAKQADPERRRYIDPVHVKDIPAAQALKQILDPVGLTYDLDDSGLYLKRAYELEPKRESAGTVAGASPLQAKIDAAAPNATLVLPPGKYTEPVKIEKPLTIRGEDAAKCIIEVMANEPAIRIQGVDGVTLENLTVRWGRKSTDSRGPEQAAVVVRDANVVMRGCHLEPIDRPRNTPSGLLALGRSNVTFTRGTTDGFEFTILYLQGANGEVSNSILRDAGHCFIEMHQGSTVKVENNILSGCEYHGVRSTGGRMEVRNNLIMNNNHAGAYLGNSSAHGVIENNLFLNNRGGIWSFAASDVAIRNNVFADSKSEGISLHASCALDITHNSFVNNPTAIAQYSTQKFPGRTGAKLEGNHFWENGKDVTDIEKSADALSGDPKFADPGKGDYAPEAGSPLLEGDRIVAGLTDPKSIQALFSVENAPGTGHGGDERANVAANVSKPVVTSVVAFAPVPPFAPKTAVQLLDAFNAFCPEGVRTHHFRTQVKGDHLVGFICVDGVEGKDKIKQMLMTSDRLALLQVEEATPDVMKKLLQLGQPSLDSSDVFRVTFQGANGFAPSSARELLEAFNANYPRGVRTHHFSAEEIAGVLVGTIYVDGQTGLDAVMKMFEDSSKLALLDSRLATPDELAAQSQHDAAVTARQKATGTPQIVSTNPEVGATDVDPNLKEITVTFDRDMNTGGYSWTGGPPLFPPTPEGQRAHWVDKRTCSLPVTLEQGRFYRVGINSGKFNSFRSAEGVPVLDTAIYFTTVGAGETDLQKLQKPHIVHMDPANGATDVDPSITELKVTFNVPMGGGFSWVGGGPTFPKIQPGKKPYWTHGGMMCVLPVQLEPGKSYSLGLNSDRFVNFQNAGGVPLEPVVYTFTTRGE